VATIVSGGYSPEQALAFIDTDDLKRTETVDAPPPDGTPTDPPAPQNENEPQSTAPPADDHPAPAAAPEVTDRAAGEHSAPARPVNPFERRELIRREFRSYTNRVLALPRHQPPKENSA
jgi:hypothetical protein